MRQVPPYLVIGSGRVARHFQCYLSYLGLPFKLWSRQSSIQDLVALSETCSPLLLLISDQAIAKFVDTHPFLKKKKLVHFSGCLSLPDIPSAHPLMCFTSEIYTLQTYQAIPFIISESGPDFSELLPGLSNQAYRISEHLRPYYHALCVLGGNFTALLWQKCFKEFENRFQLPRQILHPYLQQAMQNLLSDSEQALTGPLVRHDQTTLEANLQALKNDAFQKVYQAFVEAYQTQPSFSSP
ncbi:MAG TPA: DUF2520 domain-containing protein [Gammaproteobacteria bacterium]|nr:DUF2520 domain-containing protein [Gammaproteobacteria bacterium]